jgi:amino-acid N-acetyltransferase
MTAHLIPVQFLEQIRPDLPLALRKASMADVCPLLALINTYAAQGIMLPRTEFELSENLRDFVVAHAGEHLVGCGALHFYSPDTAEVRSLAVDPRWKARGTGRRIVEWLEDEARSYGIRSTFAFTYVAEFFRKLGYREVERAELPLKVWRDCLRCPKFNNCDETAMVKDLS